MTLRYQRHALSLVFALCSLIPSQLLTAQSLNLGPDVVAASTMFDLAKVPPGVALLQAAALKLVERETQAQLNKQMETLTGMISDALVDPKLGYLVKVRIFADEFGAIRVPGGELLHPIGVGTDPVDALTEYLRQGAIYVGGDPKLRDQSFYFWFHKGNAAQGLVASTIGAEFRPRLHDLAKDEKVRRDLLGVWVAHGSSGFDTIARAQYWLEVQRDRATLLASDKLRAQVADLSLQMAAKQAECNVFYQRFQELRVEMAEAAERQRILNQIQGVTTIISGALKAKELFSAKDSAAVSKTSTTAAENSASLTATETRIRVKSEELEVVQKRFEIKVNDLKVLDLKLDEIFRANKVPIPKREWVPPVLTTPR